MHSWIYRNRARLMVLYGVREGQPAGADLDGRRPALPRTAEHHASSGHHAVLRPSPPPPR